ncbi:hypothetical protein HMSSN036_70760 [Paenibacillus macerans]|nr:hypothetical protein HMSSN036_70760 [Paenibacillus macerans]
MIWEPEKLGVLAKGIGIPSGSTPSFRALPIKADKSSPITSAMQVVLIAIISGL